ncbi:hypothetical protein [Streptomyces sediminimaris]|uniref:hypothetical protein n=1 Tax=Streptomyces sediminimaris TaxID=3383721 RepID=UPI00399A2691
MSVSPYQAGAEVFRTLGRPVRLRTPELPWGGTMPLRGDKPAAPAVEPPGTVRPRAVSLCWGITASALQGPAAVRARSGRAPLSGRAHGPYDTSLRPHPKTVAGFRLARVEK